MSHRKHESPTLLWSWRLAVVCRKELKQFLRRNLYQHYRVLRMTTKASRVVNDLFGAFMADYRLLPAQYHALSAEMASNSRASLARVIADYIAGMTDRYAIREHRRLFEPGELT